MFPFNYRRIIDKSTDMSQGYTMFISNSYDSKTNALYAIHYGSAGDEISSSNSNVITLNDWQHVAVVYDGTDMNFYVNGNYISSEYIGSPVIDTAGDVRIGMRFDTNRNFNGTIDDIRIYDIALSDSEIMNIYNANYHRSDTNRNNCIEINEMLSFLDRWKISIADVPMPELMESIGLWKGGSGCT